MFSTLEEVLSGDYTEAASCWAPRPFAPGPGNLQVPGLRRGGEREGVTARIMELEVFIDGQFVYSQRSDGLIVATTGSTAYALLFPQQLHLEAFVLVPICPHTLSNRPSR